MVWTAGLFSGYGVRMMELGLLHPEEIISGTYPLEQTGEIFELLEKDKAGHVKVVLQV